MMYRVIDLETNEMWGPVEPKYFSRELDAAVAIRQVKAFEATHGVYGTYKIVEVDEGQDS